MNHKYVTIQDRKVVVAALNRAQETPVPCCCSELPDLMHYHRKDFQSARCFRSTSSERIKRTCRSGGHELHIISPEAIEPIQKLKVDYLKSRNLRLHTDEVLIALLHKRRGK